MAKTIGELARQVGFKGTPQHKIAEPSTARTLPTIDNAVPNQPKVVTSVDCYVSGQYVQRDGKIIEVTQRYQIFISYTRDSQLQTMKEVRARIVNDFEQKYGKTFNVASVYVPTLPIPKPDAQKKPQKEVKPLEFYRGSDMFREMTRFEKMRYDIGTEREKARTNIRSIRDRYR